MGANELDASRLMHGPFHSTSHGPTNDVKGRQETQHSETQDSGSDRAFRDVFCVFRTITEHKSTCTVRSDKRTARPPSTNCAHPNSPGTLDLILFV